MGTHRIQLEDVAHTQPFQNRNPYKIDVPVWFGSDIVAYAINCFWRRKDPRQENQACLVFRFVIILRLFATDSKEIDEFSPAASRSCLLSNILCLHIIKTMTLLPTRQRDSWCGMKGERYRYNSLDRTCWFAGCQGHGCGSICAKRSMAVLPGISTMLVHFQRWRRQLLWTGWRMPILSYWRLQEETPSDAVLLWFVHSIYYLCLFSNKLTILLFLLDTNFDREIWWQLWNLASRCRLWSSGKKLCIR